MCGRFTLTASGEEIAEAFGLEDVPTVAPRYNIAPTQEVAAVRRLGPGQPRRLALLKWGLTPTAPPKDARRVLLINARAETVDERPAFRESFARRRCLIPADGFYEWSGVGRSRRPFHIRLRQGGLFAFAGLWEPAAPAVEGAPPGACTILTTEPNELLRDIHDRMPVIVAREHHERWLDPETPDPAGLLKLLEPHPAEDMTVGPVSTRVNDPRHEDADCLLPT